MFNDHIQWLITHPQQPSLAPNLVINVVVDDRSLTMNQFLWVDCVQPPATRKTPQWLSDSWAYNSPCMQEWIWCCSHDECIQETVAVMLLNIHKKKIISSGKAAARRSNAYLGVCSCTSTHLQASCAAMRSYAHLQVELAAWLLPSPGHHPRWLAFRLRAVAFRGGAGDGWSQSDSWAGTASMVGVSASGWWLGLVGVSCSSSSILRGVAGRSPTIKLHLSYLAPATAYHGSTCKAALSHTFPRTNLPYHSPTPCSRATLPYNPVQLSRATLNGSGTLVSWGTWLLR